MRLRTILIIALTIAQVVTFAQVPLPRDLALSKKNLVRDVAQSKQGTAFDPASGGSTLSASYTWVIPQSRNFPQVLKRFKIYCSTGGTIKLKLIVPSNGGFTITDLQTLTCSTGLSDFQTVASTLTRQIIPAGGMIGFKPETAVVSFTNDTEELYMGYLRFTGDASGTHVVTESISYNGQIQAQYETEFSNLSLLSNTIYSDDCSGNVVPNYGINTTWTFSGGQCLNGGTGLDDFLDLWPITNGNDHSGKIRFQFTAAGDRVCIYKKPILDYGASPLDYGTILEADLDNNRLVFYEEWSGHTNYTLPPILSTLTLTNLTLTTGVVYELELAKDNKLIMGIITDTTNGDSQILYVENDPTNISGLAYGRFGFAPLAGAPGNIKVSLIQMDVVEANPQALIIGNSISEGTGSARNQNYATLINYNSKATRINPEGGATLKGCLNRMRHELKFCKPRYVIIESVNNNSSAGLVTEYAAQMPMLYQEILNAGAIPIILVPTPINNAGQQANKETNRAWLLANIDNASLCRTDLALSTGNDGFTYEASLMSDVIHWNTAGHALVYSTLVSEFPEVFAETTIRTYPDADPSHDADYRAFLDFIYTNYGESELPNAAGQDADNALVVEAKSNGLWDAAPVFYNHHTNGGEIYSLSNYKNPSYSTRARKIGRPTYTIKAGWAGDALAARIDYRWAPNTHGAGLFTQNDGAVMVYNGTTSLAANSVLFGVADAGNTKKIAFVQTPTGNCTIYINSASGAGKSFSSDYEALISVWRSSSTAYGVEKNGVDLTPASAASTGMSAYTVNGLCDNQAGVQSLFSDGELHCFIPYKYSAVSGSALQTMWSNHRTLVAAL